MKTIDDNDKPGDAPEDVIQIEERKEVRAALARIADAQAEFWDALREFERLTGVDIDNDHRDFTQFADPTDEDVQYVITNYCETMEEEESHA